jgi:nicotinamidase-related amidase
MATALLLIDIQNDYFDGGANPLAGSLAASLAAQGLLRRFREKSWPIAHIQHLSNRPGATFFVPGTKGVEIHENVAPLPEEKVVAKHFPNAFRETGLLEFLLAKQVDHVVVCGMMTHMCVDATVRAAKDAGFACTVIEDACATRDLSFGERHVDAQAVQAAFLAALSYFYADVIDAKTYSGGLPC